MFIDFWLASHKNVYYSQVYYNKVTGQNIPDVPTIDVSAQEFYGEGYDDSDKRIPDMTIINKQLGMFVRLTSFRIFSI